MQHLIPGILNWKKTITRLLVCLFFIPLIPQRIVAVITPNFQEARVNQKKIDKDRAKKEKEGQKQYEKAVKKHMDNQSKETKIMMKKARKDSKKNTPLK
jgi:hypothetical protein